MERIKSNPADGSGPEIDRKAMMLPLDSDGSTFDWFLFTRKCTRPEELQDPTRAVQFEVAQFEIKKPDSRGVRLRKGSAATYSRASYTCTTIGNAVFDGRVRDGIGSGHRFMATVKCFREQDSLKTAYVGA